MADARSDRRPSSWTGARTGRSPSSSRTWSIPRASRTASANPGPPGSMTMKIGGGTLAAPTNCPGFDGCGEVDFPSAGRFILTLTLIFEDGSALCDNILVLVTTCNPKARLDVIPKPKLGAYDPTDPNRSIVDLTVRLRNVSQPA